MIFFLSLTYFFSINYMDEKTITNEDVEKDLRVMNLKLNDNFTIIENDVSGMPERNQRTKIEISYVDKKRLISEITNSNNFKDLKTDKEISLDSEKDNRYTSKEILNYKYPEFYSREYYTDIENIPTRVFLQIDIKNNILEYQKIED